MDSDTSEVGRTAPSTREVATEGERRSGSRDRDGPGGSGVETGTLRTNGIETYYERQGEGRPVVFVHSAVMDHGQWDRQVEALSPEYTTVVYDVRGHGRTGGSPPGRYTVDLFVEDLAALVTALDLDRPVLCGLSMGGCIAQTYAARYPDRLAGLVLADTWSPAVLDWRDRLQFAGLNAAVTPVRLVGYERVQRAMAWMHERFYEGASGDYESVERLQAAAPAMSTDEFAKVIRALTTFHEAEIDLSTIAVPTLVLYGENETGLVKRHVPRLATEIPDATVRVVPGAGHASNLDAPEFFSTTLREFLVRVHGDGTTGSPGDEGVTEDAER